MRTIIIVCLAILAGTVNAAAIPAGNATAPPAGNENIHHTVTEDFLVNDDTTGGCSQVSAAAAADSAGNIVIAWADRRNGYAGYWNGMHYFSGWDIYFRRIDRDGNACGPGERVNDLDRPEAHSNEPPGLAVSSDGRFVVVWAELISNLYSDLFIYFQVFDEQGNRIGTNRQAGRCAEGHMPVQPAVAMDAAGAFVILWTDRSEDHLRQELHFRRFDADGNPLGGWPGSDTATLTRYAEYPCIGMAPDGRFAVAWAGTRMGGWTSDLFMQRFDSAGDSLCPAQRVDDDTVKVGQESLCLAMDSRGAFVIAWEDSRNKLYQDVNYLDIFFQLYDSTGKAVGPNRMANEISDDAGRYNPAVAMDENGSFAVAWNESYYDQNHKIFFQHYDTDGTALGDNRNAGETNGAFPASDPCAALRAGNLILAWQDGRNGIADEDIYCQWFDLSAGTQENARQVMDDAGSTSQTMPSVALAGNGTFVTAWMDDRNSVEKFFNSYDVYIQRFDESGNALGPNEKVNDTDHRNRDPVFPVIGADKTGRFAVAWRDDRRNDWDIYYQFYNASGRPVGSNQKVNDDAWEAYQSLPCMAMNAGGDQIVAWEDYRAGSFSSCLYFQRFNPEGDLVGRNGEVINSDSPAWPAVAMDETGNFVITWLLSMYISIDGNAQSISDVLFQRFDRRGEPIGGRKKANDADDGGRHGPAAAMNPEGGFVIAWHDTRNGDADVYFQMYDAFGNAVGVNRRVNEDSGTSAQYATGIAMDETGRFVIVWSDEKFDAGPSLVGQRYDAQGEKTGGNFRITSEGSNYYPVVSAAGENIVMAWQDNRRSRGFDIFGKMITWDWEGMDEVALEPAQPLAFGLLPNYPNPFNPETRIPFLLPSPGRVRLSLFNAAGRWVRDLVHGELAAGLHQVPWDGTDHSGARVDSGIYLCRISMEDGRGEFQLTRKICLVR